MHGMVGTIGEFVKAKQTNLNSYEEEDTLMQLGFHLSKYNSLNSLHNAIVDWYESQIFNRILADKNLDADNVQQIMINLRRADNRLINEYYSWLN